MKFVEPATASARAVARRDAWIELAGGTARGLEQRLGPADISDHLPGLGEIAGWGLCGGEHNEITGAIYTGFVPSPNSVSIMLSAKCHGDRLGLASLVALLDLPACCMDRFTVRSLARGSAPVMRVFDRSELVFETRSARARKLCVNLVEHLVAGAIVTSSEGPPESLFPLKVIVNEHDGVTSFTDNGVSLEFGWIAVSDWEE